MPFLGATQATGSPGCYLWPAARYPVSKPTRGDFAKAPPMVFVNSTPGPRHAVRAGAADAVAGAGLASGHLGERRPHVVRAGPCLHRRPGHGLPQRHAPARRVALQALTASSHNPGVSRLTGPARRYL